MSFRRQSALLTAALLLTMLGCSAQDDAPASPPVAPVAAPPAPDVGTVLEQVQAGTELETVPDSLVSELPYVTRNNSLTALDQSCVLGYLEVTRYGPCLLGDPGADREVVLWGDGHAAQWIPALAALGAERGWRVRVLTKYGCPPFLGTTPWLEAEDRPYVECVEANAAALATIAEADPEVVLLSGAVRGFSPVVAGERVALGRPAKENGWVLFPAAGRQWGSALARTLDELRDLGPRVVVVGDTPYPGLDAQTCLLQNRNRVKRCSAPTDTAVHPEHNRAEAVTARGHGADYVDTVPWFCTTRSCPALIEGRFVYRDGSAVGRGYAAHLAIVLGEAAGLLD